MIFEIEVDGQTRVVAVERAPEASSTFKVTWDRQTHVVDAVRVEADTLSLILPHAGHASHEVGFSPGLLPGQLNVYLHTGTLTATVNGRRSRRAGGLSSGAGEQRVIAPMPGKVLRLLVAPGDEVAARQPLVVVEAMKMENELSAARPGRVKDVAVHKGVSVEAGRLLLVVE
jgi:biotin carboxyl carrier protein